MALKISKSLPIHFWPVGTPTFNERPSGSRIEKVCFNQEFLCSDEIKTRGLEDIDGDVVNYKLQLLDTKENEISLLAFDKSTVVIQALLGDLVDATNDIDSMSSEPALIQNDWTLGASPNIIVDFTHQSKLLKLPISSGIADKPATFLLNYEITLASGVSPLFKPLIILLSADMSQRETFEGTSQNIEGTYTETKEFTPSFTPAYLSIVFQYTGYYLGSVAAKINSVQITSTYFNRTVYENLFIPSSLSLCEKFVKALIVKQIDTIVESQYSIDEFLSDMDSWFNSIDGVDPDSSGSPLWAQSSDNGGSLKITTPSDAIGHVIVKAGISLPHEEHFIRIKWQTNYPPASAGLRINFFIQDAAHSFILTELLDSPLDNTEQTHTVHITSSSIWDNADSFMIQITADGSIFVADDTVHINSFEIYTVGSVVTTYEVAYRSDYLKFSNSIAENTQLVYNSTEDFDDIPYKGIDGYFAIRVPGLFFFEREIETVKNLDLSNSTIIETATTLQEQTLLTIQDAPDYYFNKVKRILMHAVNGNILIKGTNYIRKEEFTDLGPRDKLYPLKAQEVWLNKQVGYIQNII